MASPEWNGNIHFDSAVTHLTQYGTVLKFSGNQVNLNYPVISLNQFTIKDTLDHSLTINGTLKQEDGRLILILLLKQKTL